MYKSRLPYGEPVSVGATWVASNPAGLNITEWLQPRNQAAVLKSLYGTLLSADPVLTGGRPVSCGKKRAWAPHELPG